MREKKIIFKHDNFKDKNLLIKDVYYIMVYF